jgi:hypothetical protein
MSELRRGDLDEQMVWKATVLQGLVASVNEPTHNEKRLAETVGETEWGKKATVTLGQHVNPVNSDELKSVKEV